MQRSKKYALGAAAAGLAAGFVNGIFGGAGGMDLIPALQILACVDEEELFPTCVSVMLPVSLLSLWLSSSSGMPPMAQACPYLIGSSVGGIMVGLFGQKLPTLWLHRILGIMILWGGIRYLW